MAFDRKYLVPMGYGGDGGNTIWFYNDQGDNVASLAGNLVTGATAYFARARTDHGIKMRAGDAILLSNPNQATAIAFAHAPVEWSDTNGASVVVAAIMHTN